MSQRHSLRDKLQRKSIAIPGDRLRQKLPGPAEEYQEFIPAAKVSRKIEYQSIKGDLHERLIDELNQEEALGLDDEELKSRINQFVGQVLDTETLPLNETERNRLATDLLDETLGTGPLATLMADVSVTDILVNRYDQVYVASEWGHGLGGVSTRLRRWLTRVCRMEADSMRHCRPRPSMVQRCPSGDSGGDG